MEDYIEYLRNATNGRFPISEGDIVLRADGKFGVCTKSEIYEGNNNFVDFDGVAYSKFNGNLEIIRLHSHEVPPDGIDEINRKKMIDSVKKQYLIEVSEQIQKYLRDLEC